jgi:hypothetical protein
MKVLPIQWTNADAATSLNIASDLINGNPNIAGFFSACAPTAVGITPDNYKSEPVQKLLQTPDKFWFLTLESLLHLRNVRKSFYGVEVLKCVNFDVQEGEVHALLIGAIIETTIRNGLNILGVNAFWQYVVNGAVIIAAVSVDQFRRRK